MKKEDKEDYVINILSAIAIVMKDILSETELANFVSDYNIFVAMGGRHHEYLLPLPDAEYVYAHCTNATKKIYCPLLSRS